MNIRVLPQAKLEGTGAAPLLYWLAVICGLTGITVLRIDEPQRVVPIWFGAVVGISLGQLVALLRVRIWTTALVALMSSWIIGPGIYIALCELFNYGADTETALMTLLPAFLCGYASLTERGGLLAFWYPAMLWMLVILEGETPGTFAPRAYLPMAVGLGVFFVAFLRARETRRVALWRAYAHVRLAKPTESAVSTTGGVGQLGFTALAGAGAVLLAAWVAPNLFQKDHALHVKAVEIPPPARWDDEANMPCCPESSAAEKTKEYLTLTSERESSRARLACNYCPAPAPAEAWGSYGTYRGAGIRVMNSHVRYGYDYGYTNHDYPVAYGWDANGHAVHSWTAQDDAAPTAPTYGGGTAMVASTPTYTPPPAYTAVPVPQAIEPAPVYTPSPVIDPPKPTSVAKTVTPKVTPPVAKPTTPPPAPVAAAPVVQAPKPVAVATPTPPKPSVVPPPRVAPARAGGSEPSAPWGVLFPLFAGVFLLPLGTRFVRRQVALRHLARPFWKESVDQRISNHWQRMLVGLRDAGIQLRGTEQPGAFARRVAIEGMDECATILERVRHGVRVEDQDLATMDKTAGEIYEKARKRAGVAGRIAGAFRWPLV